MEGFILASRLLKGRVISKEAKENSLFTTFKKFWVNNDIKYVSWADAIKYILGSYYLR